MRGHHIIIKKGDHITLCYTYYLGNKLLHFPSATTVPIELRCCLFQEMSRIPRCCWSLAFHPLLTRPSGKKRSSRSYIGCHFHFVFILQEAALARLKGFVTSFISSSMDRWAGTLMLLCCQAINKLQEELPRQR